MTAYLTEQIKSQTFLKLAGQPEMNLICFRGEPEWLEPSQWNDWNARLQSYLLQNGAIFVSLPLYQESRWLRIVLLNPYIDEAVVDTLIKKVDEFAGNV